MTGLLALIVARITCLLKGHKWVPLSLYEPWLAEKYPHKEFVCSVCMKTTGGRGQ